MPLQNQSSLAPERSIAWDFETNDRFGSTLMEVEDLSLAFGDRVLFEGATFTLSPGERLGIIGRNGSGKSSLLKLLTGDLKSPTGQIHRQSRLHVGVLDQNRTGLKMDDTVYESVGGADFVDVHGQSSRRWVFGKVFFLVERCWIKRYLC